MIRKQIGFTLIELVISMVIIGIGVAGILQVMEITTRHSADPMIQHQAVAVAEAYLEEILTKSYDPLPQTGARAIFDVLDYNGLSDSPPLNQFGAVVGLPGDYTVTVAVGAPAAIDGILARQIDVTVTHAVLGAITITGHRTNY
jgi:MSHA pilin protein MshD